MDGPSASTEASDLVAVSPTGRAISTPEAAARLGHPAEIYAEEIGADLIVVGSGGLSAVKRILLASVSSGIATCARTSVLVVK